MSYRPLHIVKFLTGRRGAIAVVVSPGTTLMEAAQRAGLETVTSCGGQHECGDCLIRIEAGNVSAIDPDEYDALSPEQIASGYRLACCVRVEGPVTAEFGKEGGAVIGE